MGSRGQVDGVGWREGREAVACERKSPGLEELVVMGRVRRAQSRDSDSSGVVVIGPGLLGVREDLRRDVTEEAGRAQ